MPEQELKARVQVNVYDRLKQSGSFWQADPDDQKGILSQLSKSYGAADPVDQDVLLGKLTQRYNTEQQPTRTATSIAAPLQGYLEGTPFMPLIEKPLIQNVINPVRSLAGKQPFPPQYESFNQINQALGPAAQHPILQTAGQVGGGFASFMTAARLASPSVAAPASLIPTVARQLAQTGAKRAAIGLPLLYQGSNVASGRSTPLQAASQLPVNIGANLIGLKNIPNRFTNAGFQGVTQGAAGFGGSLVGDATSGNPLDFGRAIDEAKKAAAIGGGMGLAMPGHAQQNQSANRGREIQSRGVGKALNQAQGYGQAKTFKVGVQKEVSDIQNQQRVTELKTLQAKVKALGELYANLTGLSRNDHTGRAANTLAQTVKKEYDRINQEIATKYPSTKQKNANLKTIADKPNAAEIYARLVDLGKKAYTSGRAGRKQYADKFLSRYTPGERKTVIAKIGDAVEHDRNRGKLEEQSKSLRRQEGIDKLKASNKAKSEQQNAVIKQERERQAVEQKQQKSVAKDKQQGDKKKDAQSKAPKVLEEAEITRRANLLFDNHTKKEQGTLDKGLTYHKKASKYDYTKIGHSPERSEAIQKTHAQVIDQYSQKKAEYQAAIGKSKRGRQPTMPENEIRKIAKAARKSGETVTIEYEAEGGKGGQGGDTSTLFQKDIRVLDMDVTNEGDVIIKAINENGQEHTYHVNEPESGSRIISIEATGKPSPFIKDENGRIIDRRSGEIMEQDKTLKGEFTSATRQKIQQWDTLIDKIKKGEKLQVDDVRSTIKDASTSDIEGQLKNMSEADRRKLYKEMTGKDC